MEQQQQHPHHNPSNSSNAPPTASCWVRGTAVGAASNNNSASSCSASPPARPSSSPRASMFHNSVTTNNHPTRTTTATTTATSATTAASVLTSSPVSIPPASGAGAASSPFRPQSGVGKSKTTPPRPPVPPAFPGASSPNSSTFQRGVMDALHDVLKERRVGGSGGGGNGPGSSSSRPTTRELPNLHPPRPQPPTPFSARSGGGGGGGGGGGSGAATAASASNHVNVGGGTSRASISSAMRGFVNNHAGGGGRNQLHNMTSEGNTTDDASKLPPAAPSSVRAGAGAVNMMQSTTATAPRRLSRGSARRMMQPLPEHLQQQQSADSSVLSQSDSGSSGNGSGSNLNSATFSSFPASVPSFFPASDLEESLRKKRSMWTQRHSFGGGATTATTTTTTTTETGLKRSSTSAALGGGGRLSASSGSFFDLGATSASHLHHSSSGGVPPLPCRQMQHQQQDRDGYFPRAGFANNSNNNGRTANAGGGSGSGSLGGGVFSPMMMMMMMMNNQQQQQQQQQQNGFSYYPSSGSSSSSSGRVNSSSSVVHRTGSDGHDSSCGGDSSSSSSSPADSTPLPNSNNGNVISAQQQLMAMVNQLKTEGNKLYSQRKYADAHRIYSQGLELDPHHAVLYSNRAAVHLSVSNIDAAIRDCQQAVTLDPAFWRAHVRLSRAFALRGACDRAVESARDALALFSASGTRGRSCEEATAAATSNTANGSNFSANDEEVLSIKQQLAATRVWDRARLESEGGNCVGALRLLDDPLFRNSVFADDLTVRTFRAKLQLQQQSVVNISAPSSSSSQSRCAAALACKAELSRFIPTALQTLESAMNLAANSLSSLDSRGNGDMVTMLLPPIPPLLNNFVAGLCELLVASARAAVLSGWHHAANARSTLRMCFVLRPDYGTAIALERSIATISAHMDDAAHAMADGRAAEAHAGLTTALTVDPTNARLRSSLLLLRCGASIALGRFDAAAADCTEVLGAEPGNTRALLRRSQANERGGYFASAVRDMQSAVQLQPELEEELAALVERLRDAGVQFSYEPGGEQRQQPQQQHQHQPNDNNNSSNGASSTFFRRGSSARKARSGECSGTSTAQAGSRPTSSASSSFHRRRDSSSFFSADASPQSSSQQHHHQQQQHQNTSTKAPSAALPSPTTLYDILGVARDAEVSLIRAQYLKKCLVVHPDKLLHLPEHERKQGEEIFKAVSAAWQILSDEEQRGEYDCSLLVNSMVSGSF